MPGRTPVIPRRRLALVAATVLTIVAAALLVNASVSNASVSNASVSNTSVSNASAQIDCGDAIGGFDVSNADELNAAIICINEGPGIDPDGFPISYQILLLNDIEATAVAATAVFEPLTGGSDIAIQGNGFTLSRSPNAPDTQLPLLVVGAYGEVDIFDMGLSLSLADVSGIDFNGQTLSLWAVGIEAPPGSTATGVVTGELSNDISLTGSSIEGVAIGIVSDSFVAITDSTIRSTGTDIVVPTDSFTVVDNSTLAGPVGIQMSNHSTRVRNSTILGDGGAPGGPDGFVEYHSSIVGSCTAPVLLPEDTPEPPGFASVLDFGTNAGACFDASHVIDTELSDNGCQVPTPFGCPRTVRLSPNSPALGVGDCTDTLTDQRNAQRTPPFALGCDAGAYEASGCEGSETTSLIVWTEAKLNDALRCFNGGDAGPGDYRITLAADIMSTNETTSVASFAAIRRLDSSVTLTIDGAGFELTHTGGTSPVTILETAGGNQASVHIANVHFDAQQNMLNAVLHNSPTPLLIRDSAFTGLPFNLPRTAIVSLSGSLDIENTTIDAATTAVQIAGGDLEIDQSTLTAPFGVHVVAASSFVVTNSTFAGGRSISVDTNNGPVDGTLRNSTVGSAGILVSGAGSSNVVATSNYFRLPCEGPIVDGGFNVGNCFDLGDPLPELALDNNGCITSIPTWCVQTAALSADSIAVGAGDCTDVNIDQRGWPRTPLGPGCDAGSFEALTFDPINIECEAAGSRAFTVVNEGELNAAIDCFNSGVPGAGSYTISLGNDVFIEDAGAGQLAVTSTINQPSSAFDLTFDGAGHELRAIDPLFLGNSLASNQLAIAATNAAAVTFSNISLESRSTEIYSLIRHQGSGALVAEHTSLGRRSTAPSIIDSEGTGPVTLHNTIVGSAEGISVQNASLTVSDSSFLNRSGIGNTDLGIIFGGTDPLIVTNSTFDSGSIFLDTDVDATISNSTFTGDALVYGGFVNTVVTSTLINDCFAGPTDGGNNVGGTNTGCPTGAIDIPPATDNGCLQPTPTGCPPTVAITLDSPALAAGSCIGVPTDQRGEPRTPLGIGCDTGSFELPNFVAGLLGDVDTNGTVNNADVQALLAYLAGGDEPAVFGLADINEDGQIRLDDALLLAQIVADPG